MSTKCPIWVNVIALNQDDHTKNITEPYSESRNWVELPKPVVANRLLEEIEKEAILATFEATGGNKIDFLIHHKSPFFLVLLSIIFKSKDHVTL